MAIIVSHYIVHVTKKDGTTLYGYLEGYTIPADEVRQKMFVFFDELDYTSRTMITINQDCIDTIEIEMVEDLSGKTIRDFVEEFCK